VDDPTDLRPPLDPAVTTTLAPGWRLEVEQQTPSTNAVVAERARAGEPPGLVVVTEHQTAGRGRLDRSWETPARAALTFSVLVRPEVPPARWPLLPLLTGLAVGDGVRRVTDLAVGLKWPNDLLIDERKVCGILVELVDTPSGPAAVLGIGVNVSTTPQELPVATATSLAIAGADVERSALLGHVLAALGKRLDVWQASAGSPRLVLDDYVAQCDTVGQVVEVHLPSGQTLVGRALGVDDDGRLDVETDDGRQAVGAGDVVHVRSRQ
jgi:BirA family transcriptional regulator, biotin operon repressor / biotin---[acetyl-CoA-carboxylase] ligase